jgi:hypothetical protein
MILTRPGEAKQAKTAFGLIFIVNYLQFRLILMVV